MSSVILNQKIIKNITESFIIFKQGFGAAFFFLLNK